VLVVDERLKWTRFNQLLDRHQLVGMEEQHGQQRPLPVAPQRLKLPVGMNREQGSQNAKPHKECLPKPTMALAS
jgi:hypothetical protein